MRKSLTAAISHAFDFFGYGFFQGFTYNINGSKLVLPCLWLNPVELTGINGRNEGTGVYKVTLYVFVDSKGLDEHGKENVWAELEQKVIEAYNKLRFENNIQDVSGLSITPDEFAYTGYKELSVKVSFNATVFFCNGIS